MRCFKSTVICPLKTMRRQSPGRVVRHKFSLATGVLSSDFAKSQVFEKLLGIAPIIYSYSTVFTSRAPSPCARPSSHYPPIFAHPPVPERSAADPWGCKVSKVAPYAFSSPLPGPRHCLTLLVQSGPVDSCPARGRAL